MKSKRHGGRTSAAEVTHVSRWGLWVLVNDEEFFLDYEEYPWFRDASIREATNLQQQGRDHLHWPDLDVDLHVESLRDPRSFPLVARNVKK